VSAAKVLNFRLTDTAAKRLLAEVADSSANVIFTRHALERMRQRNITPAQVINCLKKGTITESPCLDHHGFWKLTLERYVSSENIGCSVAIDPARVKGIVITAFWVK